MAEWASLKPNHGLRNAGISWQKTLFPLVLGGLLARGSIIDMYPFGLAFGAALILKGGRHVFLCLASILLGILSISWEDFFLYFVVLMGLGVILPFGRKKKYKVLLLGLTTTLMVGLGDIAVQNLYGTNWFILISVLKGVLAGVLSVVFYYALANQEVLWSGEFTKEQGMAWLVLLAGVLSGLKNLYIAEISLSVVVLTFFVLFVAQRFGAGMAAGVGAALGFLPELSINAQNLMSAGLYGLAGFCTGAFQRFGKIGIGIAYMSVILIMMVPFQPEEAYTQIISSLLGLMVFLIWPGITPKPDFLKPKMIPEVETAVAKVKTLAEIFQQMAVTQQRERMHEPSNSPNNRSELPELMNILAERVCKNCPTLSVCWEREFYKTYHFLLDLFAAVENSDVEVTDLPIEWKRHCGKIKEMFLGVQFLVEKGRSEELWRKRLEENREAVSYQYESVSQVIGHLAKELHSRHNWEEVRSENLARRRRAYLDIGVVTLSKLSGEICGDNYASIAFSNHQHVFVLSDGMGVGEGAAKMSSTALTLLEQLLTTGFEPARAVQALNSILVLRSPEEGFVTLDMAVMDLDSDRVSLIKLGAAPSYLKSSRGVEVFSSSSLPIGILNQIDIPMIELEMGVDDSLIMVTDGVHDILKTGEEWLKEFLEKTTFKKSQELANAVAEELRRICGKDLPDDGIVLVVKKNQWQNKGREH